MIGFAFCGSFCTLARGIEEMEKLVSAGEEILPIVSDAVRTVDTRFGAAREIVEKIETAAGRRAVATVKDAEPLGPACPLEALIIAPCTGNTLARMAHGITDSPVTMAAKAHRRSERPLLIALATNDALSANLPNLAALLTKRNVFFVPMKQDDPQGKPSSLVADFPKLGDALAALRDGRQLRPLFL